MRYIGLSEITLISFCWLFLSDCTPAWARGVVWWDGEDTTSQTTDGDEEMMTSLPSAATDETDVTEAEDQLPSVSPGVVQFDTKPSI